MPDGLFCRTERLFSSWIRRREGARHIGRGEPVERPRKHIAFGEKRLHALCPAGRERPLEESQLRDRRLHAAWPVQAKVQDSQEQERDRSRRCQGTSYQQGKDPSHALFGARLSQSLRKREGKEMVAEMV